MNKLETKLSKMIYGYVHEDFHVGTIMEDLNLWTMFWSGMHIGDMWDMIMDVNKNRYTLGLYPRIEWEYYIR